MDLSDLNREQQEAVTHDNGPLLVVAGAGTGKTAVITRRIAYLIESSKAKPSEILALTFTDKASAEMEERLTELLGLLFDATVTTFNAFGNELIRRYAVHIGLSPSPLVMTRAQQRIFLRDHFDELGLEYFAPVSNPDGALNYLLDYFSRLKNELISPQQYKEYAVGLVDQPGSEHHERLRQLEIAAVYDKYVGLCRQHDRIDYDDQVSLSIEILSKRPNLLKKLQHTYKYILVDEFQDTNRAQSKLLQLLCGDNANLMVVGDDDQSIYGFRGAAISNILEFSQDYPTTQQVVLTQNYRSTQKVLDAAYKLIQHNNPDRLEKLNKIDKRLNGQTEGTDPVVRGFASDELESEWLAADIAQLIKSGQRPDTIAILLRKYRQSNLICRALERNEVPYKLIGQGQSLYDTPEVRSMLYFLQSVVNPNDSESLYHLLSGEVYDVNRTALRDLVDGAENRHVPLEKMLLNNEFNDDEITQKISRFMDSMAIWRQDLSKLTVSELAFQFLEGSGYKDSLVNQALANPAIELVFANLNQFLQSLRDFEAISEDRSAVGYVKQVQGLKLAGETVESSDLDVFASEVQVLTVHRAKGLEFEHVYIPDLTKDTFPSREQATMLDIPAELINRKLQIDTDSNLKEERRLMYVAMTRAKNSLNFSWSAAHRGLKRPKAPSHFIEEAVGRLAAHTEPEAVSQLAQLELFRWRPKSVVPLQDRFLHEGQLVLGAHQIEDYLKCPAEFYWKYVMAIPKRVESPVLYGRLLHEIVRYYHEQKSAGEPAELGDLLSLLTAKWPQEGFASAGHSERSLKLAEQTITNFFKREQADIRRPAFVEHGYELALEDFKVILKGRYDAVYASDMETEIRDYKTGGSTVDSQEKANKRATENKQLAVYALAWSKQFGQPPSSVTLDFLDIGLIGRATKTSKQLDRIEEQIGEVAEGIRAGDFSPGSSHRFCSHPPAEVLT